MENKLQVIGVTVTYGKRLYFLQQVIEALVEDPLFKLFVIVDNGSHNKEELLKQKEKYREKIHIIHLDKNQGSAVGFSQGIDYARKQEGTHILLLDDDNVPERGALSKFAQTLSTFKHKDKVILCGNRINLTGNDAFFREEIAPSQLYTFFDFFSKKKREKIFRKLSLATHKHQGIERDIVENESFAYGGTLLPIEAVRKGPLPDESLVLYGDDIEYSWNIKKLGYKSYVCKSPIIKDIDLTFGQETHIAGLFDAQTKPFKVFYRIRNMVYVSLKHSKQSAPGLFLSMALWFIALFLVGAWKKKLAPIFFKRVGLIGKAIYAGFNPKSAIPEEAVLP